MPTSIRNYLSITYLSTTIVVLSACSGNPDKTAAPAIPEPAVPHLQYQIIKILPHDSTVFTEGLELHDSVMYESAGNYGKSALLAYRPMDGKVLRKVPLDKSYFGEGVSVLGDKIYQLTYQEHAFLVYHYPDMTLLRIGEWPHDGWGMTNDGQHLIAGDGTDKLYLIDPSTLKETGALSVTENNVPLDRINELEYLNGEIYANRWFTNTIYRIDAHTGKVDGEMDLGDLFQQTSTPFNPADPRNDVMNGIAASKNGTLYVTGKCWPKTFELRLY